MNRGLGILLAIALLLVAGAYVASPIWAFTQLKEAARAGDRDRLDALVDFPAVRENLKQQVDSKAVKLARQASGVGFPAVMVLGKLGAAIGDRAVDKLITPGAISAMVTLGRSPRDHKARDNPDGAAPGDEDSHKPDIHYAYLSPDRFRIALSPADRPDPVVALIMERHGLVSWRVEEIELPK